MRAKPTTETRSRTRRARGKAIPLSELARARTVSGTVMVFSSVPLEIPWTDRRDSSEGSLIQGRRGSSGQVDHHATDVREGGSVEGRRYTFGVVRNEIALSTCVISRCGQDGARASPAVV